MGNCVVIEDSDDGGEYVRIGSTVTVLDKEFDETEVYKIVGSQEADPHERRDLGGFPLRKGPAG